MKARDVMTSPALTVGPDANVVDIAKMLLARRISAVPVADEAGRLLGIVSEGDLMSRAGEAVRQPRSWWLSLFSDPASEARHYVKQHGRFAHEVMTRRVLTVPEDAPVEEIAQLLEERGIKRVPVVGDGKVVGIVSRANLLRGLAAAILVTGSPESDGELRRALDRAVAEAGIRTTYLNTIVAGGVAHLWGAVESRDELDALHVVLENLPGLDAMESHVVVFDPAALGSKGAGV